MEKAAPGKERQGKSPKRPAMTTQAAAQQHASRPPLLRLQQEAGNQAVLRFLQAKLRIGQPNDPREQEADRIAEQVTTAPPGTVAPPEVHLSAATSPPDPGTGTLVQQKTDAPSAATTPPVPESSLQNLGPGQPLDPETRAFMEPRFNHDFSQVRVHTHAAATKSAHDMNALAFTVGQNVLFDAGRYAPSTGDGRRLLAHELAHVIQQTAQPGRVTAMVQRKTRAPGVWYQEALDRLAVAKRGIVHFETSDFLPYDLPMIQKFVDLVEAIDKEDRAAVPQLLADFMAGDPYKLPPLFPSDSLANEVIARLMLLGLNTESAKFRIWHLQQPQRTPPQSPTHRDYSDEVYLWEDVLERLTNRIPDKDADAALKALDALAILFEQVRNEAASLDQNAIKRDIERRKHIIDTGPEYYVGRPDRTISVYQSQLIEFLRQTFGGMQAAYQVVLDRALTDLGSGKGEKYLQIAKDRLENKLAGLVFPADAAKQSGAVTLPVTRTEFKKGGGRHLDIFLKDKAAERRSVKITFYDVDMPEGLGSEKELDFGRILTIRRGQIQVVERIYGLGKDKTGKLTEETKENAAAIARLGKEGLHLESDDDWRKFLVAKFELNLARTGKKDEALTAVIKLLEAYLRAFTTHTPYNIDDFGDNLLTTTFPRALTGQLIHDCGVYALRIAYMLSLLREHPDLKLRFRFIVFPVHIGLIITGEGLPLYIAHNDQFTIYSASDVALLQQEWKQTDPRGQRRTPSPKDETEQFLGELAGEEFISNTDLPFKTMDVPHLKGKPAAMKGDLWRFYTRKAQVELFGPTAKDPKSPNYQFHLRYLDVLEKMRAHYNTYVVPFWNQKAHVAWLKYGPLLIKAWEQIQAVNAGRDKQAAETQYDGLAQVYSGILVAGLQEVENTFGPITTAQIEISRELQAHPDIIAPAGSQTHSERLETVFENLGRSPGAWWQREVYDHLRLIRGRQKPEAPFAKDEDLLGPVD
ncbi:MAG: DUF4157 domain-containing protein [Acidobacteriia bacterium]|nr:DUF4157 domain-containing protein [Terriglobia bacterium]